MDYCAVIHHKNMPLIARVGGFCAKFMMIISVL